MDLSGDIKDLYEAVLKKEKRRFQVDEKAIRQGIYDLAKAYAVNPTWEDDDESYFVDFNKPSHRCAYLFKYAMVHTGLVCDILGKAMKRKDVKRNIDSKQHLNLCSLGGGPGNDIVALLFILQDHFEIKKCSASLVDCSIGWKYVFESVLAELRNNTDLATMVSSRHFNYEYIACDLLDFNDGKVYQAIANADVITMVKFLSAAACQDTEVMIQKICRVIKPGALLFFVDNAAGGFYEILEYTAQSCGLMPLFGPVKHYDYEEQLFNIEWDNYVSQHKTKVTAVIWKKSESAQMQLEYEFFTKAYAHQDKTPKQRAEGGFYDGVGSGEEFGRYQYNKDFSQSSEKIKLESRNVTDSGKDSGCCIVM